MTFIEIPSIKCESVELDCTKVQFIWQKRTLPPDAQFVSQIVYKTDEREIEQPLRLEPVLPPFDNRVDGFIMGRAVLDTLLTLDEVVANIKAVLPSIGWLHVRLGYTEGDERVIIPFPSDFFDALHTYLLKLAESGTDNLNDLWRRMYYGGGWGDRTMIPCASVPTCGRNRIMLLGHPFQVLAGINCLMSAKRRPDEVTEADASKGKP